MGTESIFRSRYLARLGIPVLLFAMAGCQAARPGIDASLFGTKANTDESSGARQRVADATDCTQDVSEGRSADAYRPLSLALDAATSGPSTLHGTQRSAQRSVRLASWRSDSVGTREGGYLSLDSGKLLMQDETAGAPGATGQPAQSEEDLATLGDKQINPLSDLWSLVFQYDATTFDGRISSGSRMRHSLKFQPVMPMELTDKVRLIVRPVFNITNSMSMPDGSGGWDRDTNGFGDTQLAMALTPSKKEATGWFWGVGATWNFPTSTLDSLGTEKWAVGPSATVWHFGDPWILGVFAQSLFSFAGDGDRESISFMDIQCFALYQIPDTQWKVGMTPNIQYDFKDEQWSVPVGLGATTVVKLFDKLPTRLLFEAQYYLEQDDDFGPEWNFRFLFAPIVPKPQAFQKPIFQ